MSSSQKKDVDFPLDKYYSKIFRWYDLVNRLFTFGMDQRWRKYTARTVLKDNPARLLDLCSGTGDLAIQLRRNARYIPTIVGYDFNSQMLEKASEKAGKMGYADIQFLQGEVAAMPFREEEFDVITIGFGFRNLTYNNTGSERHLSEIKRVLKKGGKFFILESAIPSCWLMRTLYNLYLRLILIPLGGLITGNWQAYRYLALSSANYYKPDELKKLIETHGLKVISVKSFFPGASSLTTTIKDK